MYGQVTIKDNVYSALDNAKVRLVDKTEIVLKPNTDLKIQGRRQVEFIKGEAVFDVTKDGSFSIKTVPATVQVLGTKFELKVENKRLFMRVFEGRVQVENIFGREIIEPNQIVACQEGKKPEKEQDSLSLLRQLIKGLSENDPDVRTENQQKIIELIKGEAKAKKDAKKLIAVLENCHKETEDTETASRLQHIIEMLTRGQWTKLKDCPIKGRDQHATVLVDRKLYQVRSEIEGFLSKGQRNLVRLLFFVCGGGIDPPHFVAERFVSVFGLVQRTEQLALSPALIVIKGHGQDWNANADTYADETRIETAHADDNISTPVFKPSKNLKRWPHEV